jgi:hypothetical protein
MKQLMGFKSNATATLLGTNALPDAVGGATSPEKLGTALPGVYARDKTTGKLIMIDTPAKLAAVDSFLIARGNPKDSNPNDTNDTAEGATFSDEIDRRNYTIKKYLAVTGVAKVVTLGVLGGNNLIGGAVTVAGAMAGITIVDTSPNIMTDWKVRTYEVKPAIGADAAAVATALAAKIQADPDRLVDAAAATTTLVLTHRKKGLIFDAHGTDGTVCEGCTKVITTKPVSVDNTVLSVRELEIECAGYQGVTRRGDGQLGDILPYSQVDIDAVGGFVVYHFAWERNVQRQGVPVDARASRFLRLYLAVPTSSAAMITAIDTLFAAAIVTPAGLFEEDEEGEFLAQGKEADAERKRIEKEEKEVEKEEKERGKATQLPAEQAQREREEKEKAERGQAAQLPAEQKEREKHEQLLREAKEREEREKGAHRDGHKH